MRQRLFFFFFFLDNKEVSMVRKLIEDKKVYNKVTEMAGILSHNVLQFRELLRTVFQRGKKTTESREKT